MSQLATETGRNCTRPFSSTNFSGLWRGLTDTILGKSGTEISVLALSHVSRIYAKVDTWNARIQFNVASSRSKTSHSRGASTPSTYTRRRQLNENIATGQCIAKASQSICSTLATSLDSLRTN
ncbi:hypothetical protein CC1G_03451 [Coprinopsis cinerea okayama7|uniref:Uncharacterized protein n=1 Tax=Coprinopsis cinerea (strain Okayama-7 / 130 / ATCC MYA-4618 / FGSC 9003) TaxID=240176 RepID=A8NQS5_COPC7|nr:hypothetical protein CC1G_03451 [Coprinopsis cinerea okayama7\|eukprot:XP_001835669.1 hypothetical protein CC1G_03451 [Coprinopsis cinerea okayama7\